MILPKDLKLNNLVYTINRRTEIHLPDEVPFIVTSIDYTGDLNIILPSQKLYYDDRVIKISCRDISAIEISEEWLLKLGFERVAKGKKYVWLNKKNYLFSVKMYHLDFKHNGFVALNFDDKFLKELKYVHQLQNFYSDFCDEELNLQKVL